MCSFTLYLRAGMRIKFAVHMVAGNVLALVWGSEIFLAREVECASLFVPFVSVDYCRLEPIDLVELVWKSAPILRRARRTIQLILFANGGDITNKTV